MRIGELARRTSVTTKTIRYYESIGLLAEPERTVSGYRDYAPDAVEQLRFVKDAQATGLTLTEIASIVELRRHGEPTCGHVVELLDEHLRDLDRHIEALRATREHLVALTRRARRLDPASCTDPIRCQTIVVSTDRRKHRRDRDGHAHEAPHRHHHQLQ